MQGGRGRVWSDSTVNQASSQFNYLVTLTFVLESTTNDILKMSMLILKTGRKQEQGTDFEWSAMIILNCGAGSKGRMPTPAPIFYDKGLQLVAMFLNQAFRLWNELAILIFAPKGPGTVDLGHSATAQNYNVLGLNGAVPWLPNATKVFTLREVLGNWPEHI